MCGELLDVHEWQYVKELMIYLSQMKFECLYDVLFYVMCCDNI